MSDPSPLLSFEEFALQPKGFRLNLGLMPGDSLALMGPAGCGKSRLLACAAGRARAPHGSVRGGPVRVAEVPEGKLRQSVQALVRGQLERTQTERATHVISALRLWDVRQKPLAELSPSALAAVAVAWSLAVPACVHVMDGQLDALDPWALASAWVLLRESLAEGGAALVATHRPEIAERCTGLIVLSEGAPRFAGTPRELLSRSGPTEVVVEGDDLSTVKTMVEPFVVSAKLEGGKLFLSAEDGQALAARLLTHGYGHVRAVVVREPSLAEALGLVV